MSQSLETLVAPFYCNAAMSLCQMALNLYMQKRYAEGAKICKFVSTLCVHKPHPSCKLESKYCYLAATFYEKGAISKGEEFCRKARSICPRNFRVFGD
ncbi:MAG: hypothetical protein DRJ51_00095 [Thermoprotei archaeon]|nr:MAG: hypothetical protein DRJ51_00095 [Thermoprotei archaeon]RLF03522.1 MAG: hypothetical protein DRJ59_00425 [Thermoprotei archaeon]